MAESRLYRLVRTPAVFHFSKVLLAGQRTCKTHCQYCPISSMRNKKNLSWTSPSLMMPLFWGQISKSRETVDQCKQFSISHIDHVVLTVENIESTIRFYTQALGMDEITFGQGRKALSFGNQKFNLHQKGKEFEPKAGNPTPGSIDICLVTDEPISSVITHLKSLGVEVEEGPVQRTGAQGPITSVYFRDPDRNLIEVSNYGI